MENVQKVVSGGFSTAQAVEWILSAGSGFFEAIDLSNDLEGLKKRLPKARILINGGEWVMFKDRNLAELVLHLKDTTYDAEDLLRQFEDQMLRQKIEDAGRSRAGQLLSSSLSLARTFIDGGKKRVKETQDKLDKVVADVEGMGIHHEAVQVQLMPETSSVISAEVLGRDNERDEMVKMLGVTIGREDARDQVMKQMGVPLARDSRSARSKGKRAAAPDSDGASTSRSAKQLKGNSGKATLAQTNYTNGNVSVVSIFGIGGVGKTTLAQYIYNDPKVIHHFPVRIWVCVSDLFDMKRMTKEIIESISEKEFNGPCSLSALQQELGKQVKVKCQKAQKFLLVLDDIWPKANKHWEEFYAPLRDGLQGSMILVTTRDLDVARLVTTNNHEPVRLEGLPADEFSKFFTKCAFGGKNPDSHPDLQVIGHSISSRLCDSPLAAKTLGRLLNTNLTMEHWMTVKNSELWEIEPQDGGILAALRLSYLYLPQVHKRCFAICSMFPKDYSFERHELVDIWVAEQFVVAEGSMRPEDVGMRYLDDLRSRFLFETDPKFPNQTRYVMHDLIHDMAQSVSKDECFLMKDSSHLTQGRVPQTVRHMSVMVNDESLKRMREIQHLNKLRSLRFQNSINVEITWFNQLTNILFLSLKSFKLENLPESICELNSLRYLDISYSRVQKLPEKFWGLYSLQVLDATRSSLRTVHQDITKLINLRQLALPAAASKAFTKVSGLGNLSCLRNLKQFTVGNENWRRIGELKGMNQLCGMLTIMELHLVQSKEEASQARLVDKQYLKGLDLCWKYLGPVSSDNEVMEGLRPHSGIEHLKVQNFAEDRFSSSWFNPLHLPNLRRLEIHTSRLKSLSVCYSADGALADSTGDDRGQNHASSSISCSAFAHLTALRLYACWGLTNLGQFLSPESLPSLQSMQLEALHELVSLPAHDFVRFTCLRDLKIYECKKLVCPREMVLPPSLRRLSIWSDGELGRSFPACLDNVTSLTYLQLFNCDNVESIPLSSIASTKTLKCLDLCGCKELSSIGGSHCLSSMQYVRIRHCPKLTEVEQPFETNKLQTKEEKELLKFL